MIQFRDLAAHGARALPETSLPREMRAQGRPGACCTRGLACDLRKQNCTRAYRAAGAFRPSLRNGFTAYFVLFPENGSFASVAPWEIRRLPGAWTPASLRQDHTPLPYASAARVKRQLKRPPRPVPRCDDGQRPSERDGMAIDVPVIWGGRQGKFLLIGNQTI